VGVHTDITERRAAEEALRDADRRKDEFIATLAHELRNPLAPIANAASILDKIEGDSRAKWCAAMIERQVHHLSRLVDDLLDVGRITSGKIQLRDEPVNLNSLVAQNLDSLRPAIEPFHHVLSSDLCDEALTVRGDPTRLTQVLTNLVLNSAKYTPDGGRIEVKLAREGNCARLVVEDNGIGMSPELLRRAFDLFTQGPRTLERKGGGMGIGLTLVKQIALLHGGSVSAHSEGPGQGTRMVVLLPLA
jgi:signal transduction histidine kinase